MHRERTIVAVAALALAALLAPGAAPASRKAGDLPPQHRAWLEDVALLLTREERKAFLALEKDYQRDAFIREFWEARDPYPETSRNELRDQWTARLEAARSRYDNITEDRARILLLNGEPAQVLATDCGLVLWPIEVWRYPRTERLPRDYAVLFYQRFGGGPFRIWRPEDGFDVLQVAYRDDRDRAEEKSGQGAPRGANPGEGYRLRQWQLVPFYRDLLRFCGVQGPDIVESFELIVRQSQLRAMELIERPGPVRDTEWLATYAALSTDLATEDAEGLPARFELAFPASEGERTVVQGAFLVPVAEVEATTLGERRAYAFLLNGEVVRRGELFESFRYRFDLPAEETGGENLPLVFERHLRPGSYTFVLKLEDLASGRVNRIEREVEVPDAARERPGEAEAAALLAAAEAADGTRALELVAPEADIHTGVVRVAAVVGVGGVEKVRFLLDGDPVFTRNRPPFEVELRLGSVPVPRTLSAVALDAHGNEIARDELTLNTGPHRFDVRLAAPETRQDGTPVVRIEVQVPAGARLDRLELYRNDDRFATLHQPPFVHPLPELVGQEVEFLRAVAHLDDERSAEDVLVLAAPDFRERLEVRLVEVYAAVRDAGGRPLRDLRQDEVRVFAGGEEQEILRFDRVQDLPLKLVLLLDTSASMRDRVSAMQRAAMGFLEEVLRPGDRVAVVPFNDRPRLAAPLTDDLPALTAALAGLAAERGTALYDSVVFGLHYLRGVPGQRSLILISDGWDRESRFGFDATLELARRLGVTVYAIGIEVHALDLAARSNLSRLAEATGGRSFFIRSAEELPSAYRTIEEELRSRYLLTFQPRLAAASGEPLRLEVRVARRGVEVRAPSAVTP